ncbi:unnamed protein product [Zymoseptoria tritici ST99CH_3D1]|nr:unnamed protein product [Zymoseptoria tritici ST99CH_3D1]
MPNKRRRLGPKPTDDDKALLDNFYNDSAAGQRRRTQNDLDQIRAALERSDRTVTEATTVKRRALEKGRWQLRIEDLFANFGDKYKSERFLVELYKAAKTVRRGAGFKAFRKAVQQAAEARNLDRAKVVYTPADVSDAACSMASKEGDGLEENDQDLEEDDEEEDADGEDKYNQDKQGDESGELNKDEKLDKDEELAKNEEPDKNEELGKDEDLSIEIEKARGVDHNVSDDASGTSYRDWDMCDSNDDNDDDDDMALLEHFNTGGSFVHSLAKGEVSGTSGVSGVLGFSNEPRVIPMKEFEDFLNGRRSNINSKASILEAISTSDILTSNPSYNHTSLSMPMTDVDLDVARQSLLTSNDFTAATLKTILGTFRPLTWYIHPPCTLQDGQLVPDGQHPPTSRHDLLLPVHVVTNHQQQWCLAFLRRRSATEFYLSIPGFSQEDKEAAAEVEGAVRQWCETWKDDTESVSVIIPPAVLDMDLNTSHSLLLRAILAMAEVPLCTPFDRDTGRVILQRILSEMSPHGTAAEPEPAKFAVVEDYPNLSDAVTPEHSKGMVQQFLDRVRPACDNFDRRHAAVHAVRTALATTRDGVQLTISLQWAPAGINASVLEAIKVVAGDGEDRVKVMNRLIQGLDELLACMRADNALLRKHVEKGMVYVA